MKNLLSLIASLLIYCLSFSVSFAQSDSLENNNINHHFYTQKDISLIAGYQLQKNHFAEIGIGVTRIESFGRHGNILIYGISNELKLSNDFIWGLKTGIYFGGIIGMNMGLNVIRYTDFNESTLQIRPEIGVGTYFFRLVYGYNFTITNKNFEGINKHNFGLNILLNLKTIKHTYKM